MKKSENKYSVIIEPEYEDVNENEESSEESSSVKHKKLLFSNLMTVCVTIAIMSILMIFVGQFVVVNGDSMTPTYKNGDILFVEKISSSFDRFDVITFYPENMDTFLIKRVVGVPGDTVQIVGGIVYINNEKIDDVIDIEIQDAGDADSPIKLGENEYFLLGDNRNNSYDSRFDQCGIVTVDEVFGKVLFKLF